MKSESTLALVASSNGLGHARRLMHLGKHLVGVCQIELFLTEIQARLLACELKPLLESQYFKINLIGGQISPLDRLNIHEDSEIAKDGLNRDEKSKAMEKIGSIISKQGAVISDNVLWPLGVGPAVVTGGFTWEEFHQRVDSTIRDEVSKSFRVSFEFFPFRYPEGFERLKFSQESQTRLPLYSRRPEVLESTEEIWVAAGTTGVLNEKLEGLNLPKFIWKETFTMLTSGKPRAVIGRPGLGTIRDCLESGTPFLPIAFKGNVELESNVKSLIELGLLPKWVQGFSADEEKDWHDYISEVASNPLWQVARDELLQDPSVWAASVFRLAKELSSN